MKFEIIKTQSYLIVVDDSEIKIGDIVLESYVDGMEGLEEIHTLNDIHPLLHKKIIAHRPLNNSPILEGPDLLPPLNLDDDINKIAIDEVGVDGEIYSQIEHEIFIKGYRKAMEKYKYEEDFVLMVAHRVALDFFERGKNGKSNMSVGGDPLFGVRRELGDMIKSWAQKKYPKAFECEVILCEETCQHMGCKHRGCQNPIFGDSPKTINLNGKRTWVGKYIF